MNCRKMISLFIFSTLIFSFSQGVLAGSDFQSLFDQFVQAYNGQYKSTELFPENVDAMLNLKKEKTPKSVSDFEKSNPQAVSIDDELKRKAHTAINALDSSTSLKDFDRNVQSLLDAFIHQPKNRRAIYFFLKEINSSYYNQAKDIERKKNTLFSHHLQKGFTYSAWATAGLATLGVVRPKGGFFKGVKLKNIKNKFKKKPKEEVQPVNDIHPNPNRWLEGLETQYLDDAIDSFNKTLKPTQQTRSFKNLLQSMGKINVKKGLKKSYENSSWVRAATLSSLFAGISGVGGYFVATYLDFAHKEGIMGLPKLNPFEQMDRYYFGLSGFEIYCRALKQKSDLRNQKIQDEKEFEREVQDFNTIVDKFVFLKSIAPQLQNNKSLPPEVQFDGESRNIIFKKENSFHSVPCGHLQVDNPKKPLQINLPHVEMILDEVLDAFIQQKGQLRLVDVEGRLVDLVSAYESKGDGLHWPEDSSQHFDFIFKRVHQESKKINGFINDMDKRKKHFSYVNSYLNYIDSNYPNLRESAEMDASVLVDGLSIPAYNKFILKMLRNYSRKAFVKSGKESLYQRDALLLLFVSIHEYLDENRKESIMKKPEDQYLSFFTPILFRDLLTESSLFEPVLKSKHYEHEEKVKGKLESAIQNDPTSSWVRDWHFPLINKIDSEALALEKYWMNGSVLEETESLELGIIYRKWAWVFQHKRIDPLSLLHLYGQGMIERFSCEAEKNINLGINNIFGRINEINRKSGFQEQANIELIKYMKQSGAFREIKHFRLLYKLVYNNTASLYDQPLKDYHTYKCKTESQGIEHPLLNLEQAIQYIKAPLKKIKDKQKIFMPELQKKESSPKGGLK
jgi:hypothetical protein